MNTRGELGDVRLVDDACDKPPVHHAAAIHRALDAGINWFDTAAICGLGRSESVVARALAERRPSRHRYLFTKGSLVV